MQASNRWPINFRYGFNSCGHEELDKTLFSPKRKPKEIVGINLGKNKTSEDAAADYSKGLLAANYPMPLFCGKLNKYV